MKKLLLFGAIALSFATFAQVPSYVPTNGLVGWWPFNGNANDESGNGINGTVNGATLTTDRFGGVDSAYSFNAQGNVIDLPEIDPSIGTPGYSSSYSMWFKGEPTSGFATGAILVANNPANCCPYQIRFEVTRDIGPFNNGLRTKVYYRCPAENNEPVNPIIYDETVWHNIIVTIDATTGAYNYYFDGVLDANMSFTFNPVNSYFDVDRIWQIGTLNPPPNAVSHQFYGTIDDIGVWNRALTVCEIEELYSGEACNVGISEISSNQSKQLVKITNLLGQEVEYTPNTVLIYQYSDGTSEKVFTIEK